MISAGPNAVKASRSSGITCMEELPICEDRGRSKHRRIERGFLIVLDAVERGQNQEADANRQPHAQYLVRGSGANARQAGAAAMVGFVHDHVPVSVVA